LNLIFEIIIIIYLQLPEPGTRRAVQGQKVGHFSNKGGQRGPLPSIPRPSTSLGNSFFNSNI